METNDNTNALIGTAESNCVLQGEAPSPTPEPTPEQPVENNTGGSGNIMTADGMLVIGIVLGFVVVLAVVIQIVSARLSCKKEGSEDE